MTLTPLDIKRQQFARSFRGYDPAEVDAFLKQVADRVEAVQEGQRAAEERARDLEARLVHYERVELALQEALQSAREAAARTEAAADERARATVHAAEARATQITADAERERFEIRRDIQQLSTRQAEVAARLRGFLLSELEVLAHFQGDDPVGFLQLRGSRAELVETHREPDGPAAEPAAAEVSAPASPDEAADGPQTWQTPSATALAADPPDGLADAEPEPRAADTRPAHAFEVAPASEPTADADDRAEAEPEVAEARSTEPEPVEPSAQEPDATEPDVPPAEALDVDLPDPFAREPVPSPFSAAPHAEALPADAPSTETFEPASPEPAPAESDPAESVPSADAPPYGWRESAPPAAPPAWNLRSLVTGADAPPAAASDAERERIRRILDDLD